MREILEVEQQLHHANQRIAELERLLSRDRVLLQKTHSELHAIQSTYAWKLAGLYYRLRDRVLPCRTQAWLKQRLKASVAAVRRRFRSLRSRHAPGGRLGHGICIDRAQYRRWFRKNEPDPAALQLQARQRFAWEPVVSVLIPVYGPPLRFLREALDSLAAQTYSRWEACLADASASPEVSQLLQDYAKRDARFRVLELQVNRGIAGNTNAAVAMAQGEFVAFMDHDDALAPFALFEMVRALNVTPEADLLYSDEDKLDDRGQRVEPHFKPDWSPEYLYSLNYICHLTVMKRDLVSRLGGLRDGFEGAQDYDLVLRASAVARRIAHIPKVLYHWRMHAASTAAAIESKPQASDAGRRALAEHYDRLGVPATVECRSVPGIYRTKFQLNSRPTVSVIIPNRDQPDLLRRCLDSLRRSRYRQWEALIVENGSTNSDTFALYRELADRPEHRVLKWTAPFNYAAVNNFAARQANGDLLLFLNNDVEADCDDWLERLVELTMQRGIGAVGAKLLYPDCTVQHGGIILGMGGIAGHTHLNFPADAPGYMRRLQFPHNCAAVTAACMLVPREVFKRAGGFDEGFVLAFNDVDLCLRIRQAGYRVVWTPDAVLVHHESKTRGYEDTPQKALRFRQEVELFRHKWGDALANGDPYYSPHFRLDRCDWVLK